MDPDGGTIRVGGRIVSEPGRSLPPERRRMSMIFQSYALWPHMTIAENVGYGLRLRRLDRADRERRVATILDVAHLTELAGRYPHELSGGQQQRAALARALVVEPETLLLDEPLSNLDANLREEMRFEIRRLHDTYKYTTIYVTHDQDGGDDDRRHDRRDEPRPGRAGRRAGGHLPAAALGIRRSLYRRHQHLPRSADRRRHDRLRRAGVALRRRRAGRRRRDRGVGAAARHRADAGRRTAGLPGERQPNQATGRIVRQSYLGSYRDYLVDLADGQQVRVTAPLGVDVPVGGTVRLHFPPEHCRALAR